MHKLYTIIDSHEDHPFQQIKGSYFDFREAVEEANRLLQWSQSHVQRYKILEVWSY